MPFPEEVQKIGENGFHQSEVLLATTLYQLTDSGLQAETSHLMYGAIMHAAGAVKFIANLISKGNGKEKVNNSNKETILAAGLIMGRVIQSTEDGISVDFSPRNILAAITTANLIAKQENFEQHFDVDMLECFKQGCATRGVSYENYWDYLNGTTPEFEGFAEDLNAYTNKTRH